MSNLKAQQELWAQEFIASHGDEIVNVRSLVFKAAETLFDDIGQHVLPAEITHRVRAAHNDGNLMLLFQLLRQNAIAFILPKKSYRYWSWIDAAGFLFDATGTSWRYLTKERRQLYLSEAKDCALSAIG